MTTKTESFDPFRASIASNSKNDAKSESLEKSEKLDASDLPKGTVVDDSFEIVEKIGEGGMGAIYRATQIRLRRDVALKVILAEHAERKGARTRFEREARVASALRHPHAVEVYDFGEFGNTLYLAMELLQGFALRTKVDLDLPPLSVKQASRYGTQIADVLTAASEIGLVHRDLKPENIMVEPTSGGAERLVVVDFGLAFMQEHEADGRLTREGVVTGTPDYMSPEQARGIDITPAADIYALGCVLHEMLTAHAPFEGDTAEMLSRHLFVGATPIREAYPTLNIPGALDDLILRMLAKKPDERPTASAVRDALSALDPEAPLRMNSGGGGRKLGRAARMLSQHPDIQNESDEVAERDTEIDIAAPLVHNKGDLVGVQGHIDQNFVLGLAANGLTAVPWEPDSENVANLKAMLIHGADIEQIQPWTQQGIPVVADAEKSDMQRLSSLLRIGVAEVVLRPLSAEDVAKKLWRAIRKAERSSS